MTKEDSKKPKKATHNKKSHHGHKKVFDVVPPGKAPASPNSRSVIVGHKPPVQDIQFIPGAPTLRAGNPWGKHDLMDAKAKKSLTPLSDQDETDDVDTEVLAKPTAPVVSSEPKVSKDNEPLAEAIPATTDTTSLSEEAAVVPDEKTVGQAISENEASVSVQPQNRHEDERTAGYLAMEHLVETDKDIMAANPGFNSGSSASTSSTTVPAAPAGLDNSAHATNHSKTIDDLLAETDAPTLDPDPAPKLIVSHHSSGSSWWGAIGLFMLVLVLAALVLNFLLDAEIIKTQLGLPHTDLL